MIKKTVIGVCGLVFVAAFSFPALADQSIGYREYFNKGVQAFKEHDDQKALRCFKIAQVYDPSDGELKTYLNILDQKGVVLEIPPSLLPPEKSIGYRYYFSGGVEAFKDHEDKKAIRYFKIALIFNPASDRSEWYLKILYQRQGSGAFPMGLPPHVISEPQPSSLPLQPQPSYSPPSVQPQSAAMTPQPAAIYVPPEKAKQGVVVLSLAQITNNGQTRTKIQIAYHSSVIIEGKNIQRFLVVDEGFIQVKQIDADHLKIDALGIGMTFLHIWDDFGRHSLYVEIVFPQTVASGALQAMDEVQHSQPFKFTYNNDWDTYYSGKNIPGLKRQSYDFEQSLAVAGETPYGFFDASGDYIDFDSFTEFDTYTIGLSQIPLEGTSNFNLRGFDALRYLSPLTMPGTRLRGAFADVDLLGDTLGLSVSHGQEQMALGFISMNGTQFNDSYIDAVKLTLFPKSNTDQYSFNFATSYGSDRPRYLTDHVYSVEGEHRFNDFLTLNGEQGSDSSHQSSLASLQWQDGGFRTGLNFRDIDKNYSTISTLPAYQGETGLDWTTDTDFKNIKADSIIEAYRDNLDSNPDHPGVFNYDANGNVRVNINEDLWSDSEINYVDTAGELSPSTSLGLNERLSRSFGIWNSLKGTFFGGAGYQNSHSPDSDVSDFDREDVIAGIQLPLTRQVSSYTNYEYDWLNQPDSGGRSNPSVVNAGLEYQKQLTPRLSFNSQLDYHDELGVKANSNSFLSGEQSVIITSGLNYNPTPDVNIFADGDVSKSLFHSGEPSSDYFEVHLGMRITFGGANYWDPLGTVSGIVFKDRNGDGKYVKGDEGIPDVKVKVGDKEAVTDKYGRYRIQIRAKGVNVTPVLDSIPGGLLFSTPQTLNVRVFQSRTSHADFGLISQTGIYGIVFVSKNGSNVPGQGDQFIGKVKVVLDGKIIQKSDPHGAFYFRNVIPGQHDISIDINSLALNMVPLLKLKNEIDVAEGTNFMFNIPVKIEKPESEEK